MNIIENISYIGTNRNSDILSLLSSISLSKKQLTVYQRPYAGHTAFAVADTPKNIRDTDIRDWRFSTAIKDIKCSYFELWTPIEKGDYFLYRAYFHVYKNENEKEYVLLHTDPNEETFEEGGYEYYKYKQSPHMHISIAEQPFPHAHIPLDNVDIDNVLSSIQNLDKSMMAHIEMISREIIDPPKRKK